MSITMPDISKDQPELFDVLRPPRFEPSGVIKTALQAIEDGDWLPSVNIWLYTRTPEPSMIYQQRILTGAWAPGKLDCAAAGYFTAGETPEDGFRELREELGIDVPARDMQFFGRRLNVGIDAKGRERHSVSWVYLAEFKGQLTDMQPQKSELESVFQIPLKQLLAVFDGSLQTLIVTGIDCDKQPVTYAVTADSFVYNYDDYQQNMAKYAALKLGVSNAYLGD